MNEPFTQISCARCGMVELELDASPDGSLLLTVSLPLIQLRMSITKVDAIPSVARFLSEHHQSRRFAEYPWGTLDGLPVRLIKDDEHPDRFFVRTGHTGLIDLQIVDPTTTDLMQAMQQLAAGTENR